MKSCELLDEGYLRCNGAKISYCPSGKYFNICGMFVRNPEQRSDSLSAVQLQVESEVSLHCIPVQCTSVVHGNLIHPQKCNYDAMGLP